MQRSLSTKAAALAIASLFCPLFFICSVGAYLRVHGFVEVPESNTSARIAAGAVLVFCFVSLLLVNRSVPALLVKRQSGKDVNPDLLSLLIGLLLLLIPSFVVSQLFTMGIPITDVYVYSSISFISMLFWIWRKRFLFRLFASDIPCSSSLPISPVRIYTTVLYILGAVSLLLMTLKTILIINPPSYYSAPLSLNLPWIPFYGFYVTACWMTAWLRRSESPYMFLATELISMLLIIWFPFGTVAFLYWLTKVKNKEHRDDCNSFKNG